VADDRAPETGNAACETATLGLQPPAGSHPGLQEGLLILGECPKDLADEDAGRVIAVNVRLTDAYHRASAKEQTLHDRLLQQQVPSEAVKPVEHEHGRLVVLDAAESLGKTRTTLQATDPADALVAEDFEQKETMRSAVLSDAATLDVQTLAPFGLVGCAHAHVPERTHPPVTCPPPWNAKNLLLTT
jgi:hypothetical protein